MLKIVGSGEPLAVDVNGKFDLPAAIEFGRAIADMGLPGMRSRSTRSTTSRMPRSPHSTRRPSRPANCLSMQDARNLIRHGGLRPDRDILQFDPALSYGLVEYLRTVDMLKANGWSPRRCVPWRPPVRAQHRRRPAMRRQQNLSAGLRAVRWLRRRLPGGRRTRSGPDAPGIGFERKADLWSVMKAA